jgi:hypothetical protein
MSDTPSNNNYSSCIMNGKEISALRFFEDAIFHLGYDAKRYVEFDADNYAYKLAHHLYLLRKTYKINHRFIVSLVYTFRNNKKLDKFLNEVYTYNPEKSICKKYFPYLDLSGNIWKSIRILSTDELVISYIRENNRFLDEEFFMNSWILFNEKFDISDKTFEKALKIISQLRWSEEVFRRKLLNKRIKKLNIALIKQYILKENYFETEYYCCNKKLWVRKTNENTTFDSFYSAWMRPFLDDAIKLDEKNDEFFDYLDDMISKEEEYKDNDNSFDWWDGIQPDFDWEDISDSDLRDSLRDLYD